MKLLSVFLIISLFSLTACAGGTGGPSGGVGNPGQSSSPINSDEEKEYKKALTRCYKTGGTRVVKIKNYLHCY